MSSENYPRRHGPTFGDFLLYLFCGAIAVAFAVLTAIQFGWSPPLLLGDGIQPVAPAEVAPAVQRPAVQVAPAPAEAAPMVEPATIPSESKVEYQVAPAADTPQEDVQPRVEFITVDRAPEQTTITRTVPNRPAGPPIVVDKGIKRIGAPRP